MQQLYKLKTNRSTIPNNRPLFLKTFFEWRGAPRLVPPDAAHEGRPEIDQREAFPLGMPASRTISFRLNSDGRFAPPSAINGVSASSVEREHGAAIS